MTKTYLVKGLTLFSSISLVTVFLLYRTGVFEKVLINDKTTLHARDSGGNINPTTIDTAKTKKDSVNPLMFSSSKVLILADRKPTFLDSLKKNLPKYKYPKSEAAILSSSKSVIIFKPQENIKFNPDSLKLWRDSIKPIKK